MPQSVKPSRKELSHERILEAASRAIRRQGFDGVSVADVMKEAGLTHGGFYAHFDTREDMVAAAIAYGAKQSGESLERGVAVRCRRGATPFRALIEAYLSELHIESKEGGCVVAALGSEMSRQSPKVHEASAERIMGLVRRVEATLAPEVPKERAMAIAGTMVGALQMARALGGKAGKEMLAASREALLEQYDQGHPSAMADNDG
ncbi:TetR/AcrR family transcriptional regulator [Noviherbaspirillum aerium]|uniref:TetR/AcrR family transcriptional regulator n=1 Tax=Noviherbaspirillum aerium TaxID=2588497 RepID=UPI00124EB50B|nr:TetR/AcrR family transcriptional regulator [Noviherbaspirillum aerium]